MNAGVELRVARVKRGLSREALSARTKISSAMLEAIEDEQFERLPAVTYLTGSCSFGVSGACRFFCE